MSSLDRKIADINAGRSCLWKVRNRQQLQQGRHDLHISLATVQCPPYASTTEEHGEQALVHNGNYAVYSRNGDFGISSLQNSHFVEVHLEAYISHSDN